MAVSSVRPPGHQGQGRKTQDQPPTMATTNDATGSVLRSSERELAFTLKIPNSEQNLARTHKAFIDAIFRATSNDTTILPSSDKHNPSLDALREPKDFPQNDSDHRSFFRRYVNQRDTIVYHRLVTSLSISELKKRLLPTLKGSNLWMTNECLKLEEMSMIAFLWKAPTRLLHRPTLAKKINDYLTRSVLTPDQEQLLKSCSNDAEDPVLPQVEISIRFIHHGNNQKVSTEAPVILCSKPYARLMKELVSQLPFELIGYKVVPHGMVLHIGDDNYRQGLIANNDFNNSIRNIEILGLHSSHFDLPIKYNNEEGTIRQWFESSPIIIGIEPTNRSEEAGRYFVIVEEKHIGQARKEVASLLRIFANDSQSHGNYYSRLPCLANGPISDGATERTAQSIGITFGALTASEPSSNQGIEETTAWTPSRNQCVFDFSSTKDFPAPTTANPALRTSSASRAPRSQSQVTFPDEATHARSNYTTDNETTVSDLKTVFTETMAAQSQMLQTFIQSSQQQQDATNRRLQNQQDASDKRLQTQQDTTNKLLQTLTGLLSALVPPMAPAGSRPPAVSYPPSQAAEPASTSYASQTSAPYLPASKTNSTKSPNKRPAPSDSPRSRLKPSVPHPSDTYMPNAENQSDQDPQDPDAATPLLDPDPGRFS